MCHDQRSPAEHQAAKNPLAHAAEYGGCLMRSACLLLVLDGRISVVEEVRVRHRLGPMLSWCLVWPRKPVLPKTTGRGRPSHRILDFLIVVIEHGIVADAAGIVRDLFATRSTRGRNSASVSRCGIVVGMKTTSPRHHCCASCKSGAHEKQQANHQKRGAAASTPLGFSSSSTQ